MKLEIKDPPRRFPVGLKEITLAHVADMAREPDEMVTLSDGVGRELDVTRKDWGWYATPSLGGRLRRFGLRAAIMRNVDTRQCFVVLIEEGHEADWRRYMADERQELVLWLDDFDTLAKMPAQAQGDAP
jgi:hypothetical protein